jgi:hypothetical protein
MSVRDMPDKLGDHIDRRRFLRKAGATALGLALAFTGTKTAQATYRVRCCDLLCSQTCTSTTWGNCQNRWIWACCYGTSLIECRECYSSGCSWAAYTPSCGACGSGTPSTTEPARGNATNC